MSIQSCPTLQSQSLRLRPLRATDAQELFNLWSDPRVQELCGIDQAQSLESIHSGLGYFMGLNEAGFYNKWIVELKSTEKMLGECELYPLRPQIRPWLEWGIGFSSKPEFWGQGFMSQALEQVIDFAFHGTHAVRINADVLLENKRSQHFLEKNGFCIESYQAQKILSLGQLRDSVHYVRIKNNQMGI